MKNLFQYSICLMVIAVLLSCGGSADSEKTATLASGTKRYVRKNANTPAAAKDLEAMEIALKKMKELDCSDPRSWYYQGAMHWIPDQINGKNQLCDSYQTHKDLKEAWDNCTHTEDGAEINHFLVWHRMYIYHFEKIVRALSGYDDFALPYWGYTNTEDTLLNRTMPAVLRDNTSSIYEPGRLDSLNEGFPISGKVLRRLNLNKLNENKTYVIYNQNLDAAPHGAMHNYIGFGNDTTGKLVFNKISQEDAYGLMSDVATAGFDPVFWMHHSNIDRIWQQWTNSDHGQYVSEEMLKAPWNYEFFDESGEKVTYSIKEVVNSLYDLGYDFDDTKVYRKDDVEVRQRSPLLVARSAQDTLAKLSKSVSLQGGVTKLSVTNSQRGQLKLAVGPKDDGHILVLNVTVSFAKAPKGDFEIYLNAPQTERLDPTSDFFVGNMTFFGADHRHSHGAHDHGDANARRTKTFSFEITEEAHISNALEKSGFDLSVMKFGGAAAADIRIEKVSVVKH